MRERMEPNRVTDAAPLDPRAAARFRLAWAKGILEGYAAGYESAAGSVVVHAVRFGEDAVHPPPPRRGSTTTAVILGDVMAFVYGPASACRDAVIAYLRTIGQ
jgi:hypothetical protein